MNVDFDIIAQLFCYVIVLAPFFAVLATALIAVLEFPVDERMTNYLIQAAIIAGLLGGIGMLVLMFTNGQGYIAVDLGNWVALPEYHFHLTFKFLFDKLSVPFLLLSLVLSSVVGAFARIYLHRETGYRRFYLLFAVFVLGMTISSVAGTIETLFVGWELVGLSSALLVGFFQERPATVQNGLRVWIVYRMADAAFIIAAVLLHHEASEGDFILMTGGGVWPGGTAQISAAEALMVGGLLLIAASGKSALLPFSGWLPRAMEGPTPSSAIFYGALSVHLGAILLLRVGVLLDRSPLLAFLVVVLGLCTALWATLVSRLQTNIKGILAFATLTQVGLIVAEIGMGLRYVALAHIIGHACLRTLEFLRAPSLLHDYHRVERAIGIDHMNGNRGRWSTRLTAVLFRLGYEQSLFDILIDKLIVRPFQLLTAAFECLEQRWIHKLKGGASDDLHESSSQTDNMEGWR